MKNHQEFIYRQAHIAYDAGINYINVLAMKYGRIVVLSGSFFTDNLIPANAPIIEVYDEFAPYSGIVIPLLRSGYKEAINATILDNGSIVAVNNNLDANAWYSFSTMYVSKN